VKIGGYLTSKGRYGSDTVGEDMELVVRIQRILLEMKEKCAIRYAFNANCWTEVPEDFGDLKKQRFRWHRGLVEILSFHRRMLFNPQYGRVGLVALPYFLIFEVIGPIVEIQGYILFALAFGMGILNAKIVFFIFFSTILMGSFISLFSFLISEKETHHFSVREMRIMLMYAIVENFGIRQMVSFWRLLAIYQMFKRPTGWGKIQRKGFDTDKKTQTNRWKPTDKVLEKENWTCAKSPKVENEEIVEKEYSNV
jgi:cellulose synthase/poly-beta-1,6-N-acetylglucosamine synthase-like glycosyltransferase